MSEHVLQQILAAVARIEARFDAQSSAFDAKLDAQSSAFDAKLDAQSSAFDAKLDAQSARFEERLDAQSARFDAKLDAQSARFDEMLDAQSARFEERLDAQSMRLERLEIALSDFRAEQNKTRADIMERIDRLQNTMGGLQADILVNFGATDGIKRAHDSTREELRSFYEMLSITIRKVRVLESQMRDLTGG